MKIGDNLREDGYVGRKGQNRGFFCEGYVDQRDLHSFPTRRSSDLSSRRRRLGLRCNQHHPRRHPRRSTRSEEHTSELQSRENLVCRLLLEKKNRHGGDLRAKSL